MDEQQCLGGAYKITWGNRLLKFGPVEEGMKADLVAQAKLDAVAEFNENAALGLVYPGSDPTEFGNSMISGDWKWGGRKFEAWRQTPNGMRCFLVELLAVNDVVLSDDDFDQLARDKPQELADVTVLCLWDIMNPKTKRPEKLEEIAGRLK